MFLEAGRIHTFSRGGEAWPSIYFSGRGWGCPIVWIVVLLFFFLFWISINHTQDKHKSG